jgi:hypothetical protein
MSNWIWWIVWAGLSLAAIGFFAYLAFDLFSKAGRVLKELEKTFELAAPLLTALESKPEIKPFAGNLLDDPAPLAADYARYLKKREAKRAERQRRLINKLIDFNESEFKP